jgi:hypothetical protein
MATSSADFMQMYLLNFPVPSSHTFSLSLLPNLYNEIRIKFLLYRGSEIGRHMVVPSLLNVGDFSIIYNIGTSLGPIISTPFYFRFHPRT